MKSIKELYSRSNIVIRSQANGVLFVLVIIIALMPLIIIEDALQGDYINLVFESLIELSMLVSLLALYRGRYRLASTLPLVMATIAVIGLSFSIDPVSQYQIDVVAFYMFAPVVLSLCVSETKWHTFIVEIVGLLVILSVTFFLLAPGLGDSNPGVLFDRVIVVCVIYTLVSAFAYHVASANKKSLNFLDTTYSKSIQSIEMITRLVEDVQVTVESARALEKNFDEILASGGQITEQVAVFRESSDGLAESTRVALESVQRTTERAQDFHHQVDEQNTVVQESTAAVNQMSASLDSVAEVTAVKQETTDTIVGTTQKGMASMADTAAAVSQATEDTAALLDINRIVSDIAAQTSLLSMNAAIEAAHAGDAGRGFAVVAEEIRKLASSTAENSDIIAENLKRVIAGMEKSKQLTENTRSGFGGMVNDIKRMSEAFGEITSSTTELSQGGKEILHAMELLQNSSVAIRDGSNVISEEQVNMKNQLVNVSELAERMKMATDEITNAVTTIIDAMEQVHQMVRRSSGQVEALNRSVQEMTQLN